MSAKSTWDKNTISILDTQIACLQCKSNANEGAIISLEIKLFEKMQRVKNYFHTLRGCN